MNMRLDEVDVQEIVKKNFELIGKCENNWDAITKPVEKTLTGLFGEYNPKCVHCEFTGDGLQARIIFDNEDDFKEVKKLLDTKLVDGG